MTRDLSSGVIYLFYCTTHTLWKYLESSPKSSAITTDGCKAPYLHYFWLENPKRAIILDKRLFQQTNSPDYE